MNVVTAENNSDVIPFYLAANSMPNNAMKSGQIVAGIKFISGAGALGCVICNRDFSIWRFSAVFSSPSCCSSRSKGWVCGGCGCCLRLGGIAPPPRDATFWPEEWLDICCCCCCTLAMFTDCFCAKLLDNSITAGPTLDREWLLGAPGLIIDCIWKNRELECSKSRTKKFSLVDSINQSINQSNDLIIQTQSINQSIKRPIVSHGKATKKFDFFPELWLTFGSFVLILSPLPPINPLAFFKPFWWTIPGTAVALLPSTLPKTPLRPSPTFASSRLSNFGGAFCSWYNRFIKINCDSSRSNSSCSCFTSASVTGGRGRGRSSGSKTRDEKRNEKNCW